MSTKRQTKKKEEASAAEPAVVPPQVTHEEVIVRKKLFYDFLPRSFCRTAILVSIQLFRAATTLTLILMVTNFLTVVGIRESFCQWRHSELKDVFFGVDVYVWNLLALIFIGAAWCISMITDANAAEKDAIHSTIPALWILSVEGWVFTVLHQLHFVAYVLLSNTLFECNGPHMIPLKMASAAYLIVIAIPILRIPIAVYHNHASYFTLTKKVTIEKKKE